nr:hypothetical protein [uncultured bacterium]
MRAPTSAKPHPHHYKEFTLATTPIYQIQGSELYSPLANQRVTTHGVVTGFVYHGFFIQDPEQHQYSAADAAHCSHGLFVFSRGKKPPLGCYLEIDGEITDYTKFENDKPVTQLHMRDVRLLDKRGPKIAAVTISAASLPNTYPTLASYLNNLEGMLVKLDKGATFVQPSNPFGDYVLTPADWDAHAGKFPHIRTEQGGVILDHSIQDFWLPGFRIIDKGDAPRVNVGATLKKSIQGPLDFRVGAYQIAVNHALDVQAATVAFTQTALRSDGDAITVLTLNTFNLDPHIENAHKVSSPNTDIDDDIGAGQFRLLAGAIVEQASAPDIIALQEIQDSDGAELGEVVSAANTYQQLIDDILRAGGPRYAWIDVPPQAGEDGGQPGGNIRNAYLYNPTRVKLLDKSVRRLGENTAAYAGSRKPLLARFETCTDTPRRLAIINVHLASKRMQHSIFADQQPGHDPRKGIRAEQAAIIREHLLALLDEGLDYYVTGDFNDVEGSETLTTLLGEESVNLVYSLPSNLRFDYNHRGKLHVLMHGIVSRRMHDEARVEYEILHGNELLGVTPGRLEDAQKASDHAYVIARLG